MKKIYASILLLLFLKINISAQLSLKPVLHRAGAFITKEDFLNDKITALGIFDSTQKIYADKVIFLDEFAKKTKYSFKQLGYFALRDNKGEVFYRDNDIFYKIVLTGNICMFANPDVEILRDSSGKLISLSSSDCWYAEGFNGIRKDYRELLRKDQELFKAFLNDPRKTEAKIIHYIRLYNTAHPVE